MAKSLPKGNCGSVDFTILVDDFRSHRIPGLADAKVGTCFIRASELVANLDLDKWLKVNPRVPNRNSKEVLTGHVVKGIRQTLQGSPTDFAIKNQGLFLLVARTSPYERLTQGGRLTLTLDDPDSHGLCNGGHSYAAIREYAEDASADTSTLNEAWVRLHIFEGIESEKVTIMAEGLNVSKQVDNPSLMNLEGRFEDIKQILKGKLGANEIAYHQGHSGAYYITEIMRAMMFFNRERYNDRQHPSSLYRQQSQMIEMFRADSNDEKGPSPIALIIPHIHEILMLMDKIAKETPAAAKRLKPAFEMGRMVASNRKNGPRAGSDANKNTKLHFIDEHMSLKVPNGWLMVMLAAFRANVDWDLKNSKFAWKVPLEKLLPEVIDDLVRVCVQEYRDNKIRPDEIARNPSVYEQCYVRVELKLLRLSAQAS